MASIGEMVQLAEYHNKLNNPLGNAIESIGKGIMGGISLKRQAEKDNLDRIVKIIEINKTMQEMKDQATRTEIMTNYAKGAGILPPDAGDLGAAREQFNIDMGSSLDGKDNSYSSKLKQLFDTAQNPSKSDGKMNQIRSTLNNYDLIPSFSEKGGMSLKYVKKSTGMTQSSALSLASKINEEAYKMAKRKNVENARIKGGAGFDYMSYSPAVFEPTDDQIKSFIPLAKKKLEATLGDIGPLDKALGDKKAAEGPQSLDDLFGE